MSLFEELKRRNVVRVAVAYVLATWVLIQVTDTVAPALGLPDWTVALVTWLGIIGLPIVLIFSWVFEITPEGLKREVDVDRSQSITGDTGRKINYVVIGLLVAAVILLLVDREFADDSAPELEKIAETDSGYDSIGVLPFVNMSDDPNQDYFSDGIAEELLNALAKLNDLQVAARTSSFAFKGQNQDISEIGRQLNVDTVHEGSVRKAGDRLRITAQLIDSSNGYHLWSETYDRELTDVFAIQDEITAAIVEALLPHLDMGERSVAPGGAEVTNMGAYDAYLQGRHEMRKLQGGSLREALRLFRAATDADPQFAAAWAARGLAVVMMREDHFVEGIPREESHMLARNNIDRALEIDPDLPEAYVAESFLLADTYQYEEALASLEKALSLNANLAEAWMWRSRLLGRFGRVREARDDMLTALQLDPHNPIMAIMAVNLLGDYFDADFMAAIRPRVIQVERARQILKRAGSIGEPLTTDLYRSMLGNNLDGAFTRWEAVVNFRLLKEIDEEGLQTNGRNPGDFMMWVYMGIDATWDKAQALYDALPEDRQRSVLNLEELSVMQVAQGKCREALETLQKAHGDAIPIHGEFRTNASRSNVNLALNRVYCMRRLGLDEGADELVQRLTDFVNTLRANTVYDIYVVDAKLRVLDGDIGGALQVLEDAAARNEVGWNDRWEPILRTLADEPRFRAVFASIDEQIDGVRAELGMPPAKYR